MHGAVRWDRAAESLLQAPLVLLEKHSLAVTSQQGRRDGGCPCALQALEGFSLSPGVGDGSCDEQGKDARGAWESPMGQNQERGTN